MPPVLTIVLEKTISEDWNSIYLTKPAQACTIRLHLQKPSYFARFPGVQHIRAGYTTPVMSSGDGSVEIIVWAKCWRKKLSQAAGCWPRPMTPTETRTGYDSKLSNCAVPVQGQQPLTTVLIRIVHAWTHKNHQPKTPKPMVFFLLHLSPPQKKWRWSRQVIADQTANLVSADPKWF